MFVTILALTAWRLTSSSSWGAAVWTFAVRDMIFSDPHTMLCCWCVGSLHVFHPPWLASSFVVQKHNIGVVGREAEKMLLMTKYRCGWRTEVCIHDEKRLIVNILRGMISFVCFCLQSCSWSVPWRWCVFRRIACFCSIWPGPAKHVKCLQQEMLEGREKISPHSTENAYTQICKVRHSKGKDKRTCMYVLCMFVNLNVWISEPRIFLWDITRLLVVVFLFWVHKDLSRLRGCSYHSKKLWMGRTLRRSSQGMNWCKGWQNFPKFRLVILHKQLSIAFLTLIVFLTNRDSWNRIIEYGI